MPRYRMIGAMIFLVIVGRSMSQAQMFQCPAGSASVSGGGGMMCMCPDGSYAGMSGCQSQPVQPQYVPPQEPPPQPNIFDNALTREFERLGEMLMKGEPLRQDIPLSSGLVAMQNAPAPPPAPNGYSDPFAARWTPPASANSAPHTSGSIWDPNNAVRLEPPPPPSAPTGSQPGSSGIYLNPKNCTFDSPSCR
jgi:hypothetical protein